MRLTFSTWKVRICHRVGVVCPLPSPPMIWLISVTLSISSLFTPPQPLPTTWLGTCQLADWSFFSFHNAPLTLGHYPRSTAVHLCFWKPHALLGHQWLHSPKPSCPSATLSRASLRMRSLVWQHVAARQREEKSSLSKLNVKVPGEWEVARRWKMSNHCF